MPKVRRGIFSLDDAHGSPRGGYKPLLEFSRMAIEWHNKTEDPMNHEEIIKMYKYFEGMRVKEVRDAGDNWYMLFEAPDGTFPSMGFWYDDAKHIVVKAK